MAETFRVLFRRVDVRPLSDGLASVFNAEATDQRRYFEVTRVAVRPSSGSGSATTLLAAKVGLYRITAVSGGTAVSAVKRDTGSADLPSQVSCVEFPDSVTTTGAALRLLADAPTLGFATGNTWQGARVYGGSLTAYQRHNSADALRLTGDSNIERIILREGQGIALRLDTFGVPRSTQWNMTVRNESTGATYQFRTRNIGHPERLNMGMLALFNASGSGVVLGVSVCEYPNDGESNIPGFRLARIDAATGGESVTPDASDTGNSVPASLVCMAGDFDSQLYGQSSGVPIDWSVTHGQTISVYWQQKCGQLRGITGVDPFFNVGQTPGFQIGQEETLLFLAKSGSGVVLRPNEGLALLAGRAGAFETSTFAYYDVEMTVLHYPPPSGGGSNTYSRGRVVNAGSV